MRKILYFLVVLGVISGLYLAGYQSPAHAQNPAVVSPGIIALGKALFFDQNLSVNRTQSCASCHGPEVGYTGPDSFVNAGRAVYQGALDDRFGNRKPPASAYAGYSPNLYQDEEGWIGGMFWDGRATGAVLGDPLAEQAGGPFLNPLEMGMPDARLVCLRVAKSTYADLFISVYGTESLDCVKNVAGTYELIVRSIAAYERSAEVNPFTSKFDQFWDNAILAGKEVTKIKLNSSGGGSGATATAVIVNGSVTAVNVTNGGSGYLLPPSIGFMGGMGSGASATASVENGAVISINVTNGGAGYRMAPRVIITGVDPYAWQAYRNLGLTDEELKGLASFNDPNRANCASCHSLEPGEAGYPLFTDYRYDNIGLPKNPDNPFYTMAEKWNPDGTAWVDTGLGGYLKSAGYPPEIYTAEMGKFKVPTLRNVDLRPSEDFVKAYGHNGYFKSLSDLIMFYAWRGMMDNGMGGGGMGGMGGGGMGGGGMGGGMGGMMFPDPEVNENLATLNMFPMMDQANILAFLKTLSDGYFER